MTGKIKTALRRDLKNTSLEKYAEELLPFARPCIQFQYQQPKERHPVGISRVGGIPDLPDSVEWPEGCDQKLRRGGNAEFLAQFNLAELPAVEGLDLPREGYLWVFVRNSNLIYMPAVVLYADGHAKLKPRAAPKAEERKGRRLSLSPAALAFQPGVALPFSSKPFAHRFAELPLYKLSERLASGLDRYHDKAGVSGQIGGYSYQGEFDLARIFALQDLGHADYWNSDYWESLADLENQIKHGNPLLAKINPAANKKHQEKLKQNLPKAKWIFDNNEKIQAIADSYHLLCMFRPDILIGLEFGDGMYLDFLVKRDALVDRDFSQVKAACLMLL